MFITGLSHGSCAVLTTQDTGCEHHYSKRKLKALVMQPTVQRSKVGAHPHFFEDTTTSTTEIT